MGACRHKHRCNCGRNRRKKKHRRRRRTCPADNTGAQEVEQATPPVVESPPAFWAPLWIERIPDWTVQPIGGGVSQGHHHSGRSHGMQHHSGGSHGMHHRTEGSHGIHRTGQPHEPQRSGGSPGWL
ncbi:MAG: hypothetical protein J7559_11615 [Cohnella sp.]|nr:hypothetical protein [Cohnella sp.]